MNSMWIRLTRKLADFLDGIDVSDRRVGDVFNLPTFDAHLLIAEGWAERYIACGRASQIDRSPSSAGDISSVDTSEPSLPETLARLRRLREQMGRRDAIRADCRRIEDRIREELRDARAETIKRIDLSAAHPEE
jgi:hypothetical protein